MQFTVTNPVEVAQHTVARASVPVPQGALSDVPSVVAVEGAGEPVGAQARVITRHPDGSVRRMMLSVPLDLAAGEARAFALTAAEVDAPPSMLTGEEPARIETDAFTVLASAGAVQLLDAAGGVIAVVEPFGPEAGGDATLTVLDEGPQFTWLRYDEAGEEWSRQVDVQVSRLGEITLTHRIQAHPAGDHWTPDFGWTLTAPGASAADLPDGPARMLGRDPNSRFADESNAELIAQLALGDGTVVSVANPLALRQNRGTFEATAADGSVTVRSNRNEPVEDLETEGLMIQEGAWRFSELTIAPAAREALAARLDDPVHAHADWRVYDAVYGTGEPLEVEHPVLRECVERFVFALQDMQMKGDDLGSMPWGWDPGRTSPDYTSSVRLNHSLYVWEDWFRGGDSRLRQVAHDWLRNYHDLGMYWGPNEDLFGACRRGNLWRDRPGHGPGTFNPRFATSPPYVHKGWSNFYLMFEETGDPRYRDAAEAAAEWSIANQHAGLSYTRVIGVVTDAVKMYEYTGEQKHLDNAIRIWGTFQEIQGEDLLFTESGRPAVGNDLYIGDDSLGYRNPFVKPYIVQYATNSLPYLLRRTPDDQRLRDTIVALNDFMARVQQPGGGWGYPHPSAAGLTWNLEYIHGIILAHEVAEAKEAYLDAVARNLRPTVQLAELYGWPASGLNPWEAAAGINAQQRQERYELATDRPAMRDYDEGQVKFGYSPDQAVHFQAVLRDYLRHRSEESLFESDELLEKIKRLRTTLDPTVVLPARAAMGADGVAEVSVTVQFRAPGPVGASVEVADLPAGVTAEPAAVEWTVERGRTESPPIRLRGTVEAETPITIRWQIGRAWEGTGEAILEPGGGVAVDDRVGYIGGEGDPLALALLAIGFDPPRVSAITDARLDRFSGLVVGCEAHAKNYAGLADAPERLLEFVRAGGNAAIFQLQDEGWRPEYLPLPLTLSNDSATAGVIVRPDHPIFAEPAKVESLAGAILYDTIVEADQGWEVLALDDAGRPAILQTEVGEGRLLVIQPSIDRYLSGMLEAPEGLSVRDCADLLRNVIISIAG
ncbi:MAG: hypothetical protein ACOX9R_10640 [Armatimonadota bacterium]